MPSLFEPSHSLTLALLDFLKFQTPLNQYPLFAPKLLEPLWIQTHVWIPFRLNLQIFVTELFDHLHIPVTLMPNFLKPTFTSPCQVSLSWNLSACWTNKLSSPQSVYSLIEVSIKPLSWGCCKLLVSLTGKCLWTNPSPLHPQLLETNLHTKNLRGFFEPSVSFFNIPKSIELTSTRGFVELLPSSLNLEISFVDQILWRSSHCSPLHANILETNLHTKGIETVFTLKLQVTSPCWPTFIPYLIETFLHPKSHSAEKLCSPQSFLNSPHPKRILFNLLYLLSRIYNIYISNSWCKLPYIFICLNAECTGAQ